MIYVLTALVGYLVGSFSTAKLIGHIKGKDISAGGTGNLGASNTTILLGWKCGVLVGAVDILKGFFTILLTLLLSDFNIPLGLCAGVACILGHIFPFYLQFKGGKGFATLIGVIFGFDWKFGLLVVLFIFLITWITDYIALATCTTAVLFPIRVYLSTKSLIALSIVLPVMLVVILKHRLNFRRIFITRSGETGLSQLIHRKR